MKGRGMKLSHYLIGLLLLLVFLSISIGTSDFSWGKLFDFDQQTWLLFQESRLPRTISILLTASSMSMAGLLMQTITQNQFAAPSTVGTTEAAKLGMVLSLFVFPSASLTQKMLFAFVSSILFTLFFLALQGYLKTLMKQDLVFILLICLALRSLFRNISTFLQVLMDPNEYDKLQNSLFASFQHLNTSILAIGSLIILALTIFFFRKAVVLDVLHLQRETAQILGLDVEKEQKEFLWGIVLLTSTATALVGPMAFFGFMLANLTYLIVKDYQHKLLFIVAILVGFISLTLGQALIERVFALEIRISMIIESVGGFLFFILLYRRARQ
ncbi:iron chelate uptake ABC transporter family permease subunit [Streptococcus pneumoniae]|nr:iron chelate uptake ABC transporter family permease subunit [Streptococcus pneumoniae]